MWTPRRIVLLAVGFVVFFSGYAGYASLLGGIDALPPLPERYLSKVEEADIGPGVPRSVRHSTMEDKIKLAFGPDCEELNRSKQLELNARRTC